MKIALLFNLPIATLVLLAIATAQVAQTAPVPGRNEISSRATSQDCPGAKCIQVEHGAGRINNSVFNHDEPTCPKTGCIGHVKPKPAGEEQTAEQPQPEGKSHP
ncbi:hypothetical protein CF327_g6986 [Tilletia walkeri]|uniref:Long chronological lifespan protein 2 n=1 Tax=Tilletia walkeri TaxID=117179 RepID=A0A8X7N4S9_9BASI|nr:hypothetical protein CF327_g6986 [Tilletia walkeri]KAE8265699.1 hypothetical protein A4X09_0g6557 [Tilletia walkeri]